MEHIPGADRDRFAISTAFQDPRLSTPAAKAFLNDSSLAKLFPAAKREPDEQSRLRAASLLFWLPTGGGTIYLPILLGNFVEQTLARMRFFGHLSEEYIHEYVVESIDQLQKFADGEEVEALVLTGLVGIEVEDNVNNYGAWGIRPVQGLAVSEAPSGGHPVPKSVVWMKVPHRLVSVNRADINDDEVKDVFGSISEQAREFQADLRRNILAIQFGLTAWAVEQDKHTSVSVQATGSWSMLPVASAQPPWVDGSFRQRTLTSLNLTDLHAVASVVDGLGKVTHRLDIALERIVRIASEDRRPADALIDAVIAWENMLGSKSETTFKVCAALSWLLEPTDLELRRNLYSNAKKIYNARSRIVHGEIEDNTVEAAQLSRDALTLAIRAFRRIHSDAKLKAMRSSPRAETILLEHGT